MPDFTSNPAAWGGLIILGIILLELHFSLWRRFRGGKSDPDPYGTLARTVTRQTSQRRQQQADLDELHRRVAELKAGQADTQPEPGE